MVMLLQIIKCVDDVFQSIHVIPIDVPISQVSVALVLNVSNVVLHDISSNVISKFNVSLEHSHLQFTENLKQRYEEINS